MASSSGLTNGTTSYTSSTATTGDADTVQFPDRYGYVTVTNLSTASFLFVRTDGTAATIAGDDSYVVQPGKTEVFANANPIWYQSSLVIPSGAIEYGSGNTSDSPSSPGQVTPMTSLVGVQGLLDAQGNQLSNNPGTTVSVIGASETSGTFSQASVTYTVAAAG